MAVRPTTRSPGEPSRHARTRLAIRGLICGGGGSRTAERALARVPGVLSAYVNPAEEIAHVKHEIDRCPVRTLVEAVGEAGFEAIPLHSAVVSRPSESKP